MKKLLALLIVVSLGAFSYTAEASGGDWTSTFGFSCSLSQTTGQGSWTLSQGVVGAGTIINGHLAGSGNGTFTSSGNDCNGIDPTKPFFAVTYPAADLTAFRNYFEFGGSPPNENYGLISAPALGGHTRVVSQDNPQNGVLIDSTTVNFGYTIFYNDTEAQYDTSGIYLQDLTAVQDVLTATSTITSSGNSTISQSYILIPGHSYNWRAYISDSSGINPTVFAPVGYGFQVKIAPPFDENSATSTAPSVLGNFFNLPLQLTTHYPFNYFFDTIHLVQSQATLTGTSTFPTYNLDLGQGLATSTLSGQNVELFGTSTIMHYLPNPVAVAFRTLMTAVLYVGTIFGMVLEVKKFWA